MHWLRVTHPQDEQTVVLPGGGPFVERFRGLAVRVIELPLDRLSLSTGARAARMLHRLRPDVVHSHGKGAGVYARIWPRSWCRGRRIHSYHGFHVPTGEPGRGLYLSVERLLLPHTDRIIAVSASEAGRIETVLPGSRERLLVIPNVVDRAQLDRQSGEPLPREIEKFLERHAGDLILAMVARPDPVKNHALAVTALEEATRRAVPVACVFVGISPERLRDLGATSSALLAAPELSPVAPLLRRCQALLLTSRREGSPLTVLEAQGLGRPVVGTRVDGIRDLVTDDVDGLLCAEEAGAIAGAIARLAGDPTLRERLGTAGLTKASASDPRAWAEKYHRVYAALPPPARAGG